MSLGTNRTDLGEERRRKHNDVSEAEFLDAMRGVGVFYPNDEAK